MVHFKETNYGFEYGSATITRLHHNEKKGWVVIELKTPKKYLQLYVTKTGKVRIHEGTEEWKKEQPQ